MIGRYRVYSGGDLIAEIPNVITNSGKIAIGRFLSGERFTWADALSLGAGESPAIASNKELEMEFWREEIDMRQYDDGEIVLRSIIPASVSGKVYEMGVYCTLSSLRQLSSSPVAVYFDSSKESWSFSNAAFNDQHQRVGSRCVLFTAAPGSNATGQHQFAGDFSLYDENSYFYLSYKLVSGTISSVTLRLSSSDTTYREYYSPITSSSGDYSTLKWGVGDFDLVGNSDWTDFNRIDVVVEGDGVIAIDAFAVRNEPVMFETVLVSRTVFSGEEFIVKDDSQEMQIEYVVDFEVNT